MTITILSESRFSGNIYIFVNLKIANAVDINIPKTDIEDRH